jgi:hypothetical protein
VESADCVPLVAGHVRWPDGGLLGDAFARGSERIITNSVLLSLT